MPDETVLTSNRKEDPMGLLEAWRRSREAMDEEMDERTELAASKALGAVAAVTVPFAVFALAALVVVAPVSAEQREFGLQLLIPAILAVAAATLTVSLRRRRALGARLERAILVRSLWVWPVAAVVGGLVEFAWHRDPGDAAEIAVLGLVGALVGTAIRYLRLSRRG